MVKSNLRFFEVVSDSDVVSLKLFAKYFDDFEAPLRLLKPLQ